MANMRDEYWTIAQLRAEMGVSKGKMAQLIKAGIVKWEPNPFDKRIKLVRREDADAVLAEARAKKKGVPVAA